MAFKRTKKLPEPTAQAAKRRIPPTPRRKDVPDSIESLGIQIRPSFEPEESFLLNYEENDRTWRIHYRLIRESCGWEVKLNSPKEGVPVEDAKADAILACAGGLNIPFVPDSAMGLDGTTTTVTITQGWNKIELVWWHNAPRQWKQVENLVRMVRDLAWEIAEEAYASKK